jgi:2,5-dioxopentanoate dehydrogenase
MVRQDTERAAFCTPKRRWVKDGVMTSATETVGSTHKPLGRSIVACRAVEGPGTPVLPADSKFYAVDPHSGNDLPTVYLAASPKEVEDAGWKAWAAFHADAERSPEQRARLLEAIAAGIMGLGEDLLALAADETGLGPARLVSERERTVNTLKLFAGVVRTGEWVEAVIETGQPSRRPTPKPDLRKMLRPLGPVAVFGAGNFPLAYSTAGGDVASALAAGCPVIVKGHPGHPGTGELVAQAVAHAVEETGFDPGTFSFLHAGGEREIDVGQRLVKHPAVRAVGFTGSLGGGMSLVRIAAERPDPIPVFAEMGSTNPVFVLPGAAEAQPEAIAERLYSSATSANGQMCTCPGLVFVARGSGAEAIMRAIAKVMNEASPQMMLSRRTRRIFAKRIEEVAGVSGIEVRGGSPQAAHRDAKAAEDAPGTPVRCSGVMFKTTFDVFRRSATLHEEVFGPALIVVVCENEGQLADAAANIHGSLTGTIWAGAADSNIAKRIEMILEQRVGRIVFNGVPTGVEVSAAMVHGGPYPATSRPESTAVGPEAIRRWARPVCYQNVPEAFLPPELRNGNPLRIRRKVNGEWAEGEMGTARG